MGKLSIDCPLKEPRDRFDRYRMGSRWKLKLIAVVSLSFPFHFCGVILSTRKHAPWWIDKNDLAVVKPSISFTNELLAMGVMQTNCIPSREVNASSAVLNIRNGDARQPQFLNFSDLLGSRFREIEHKLRPHRGFIRN